MFFPDRIKNIGPGDRVLEIGPGGRPHPRSDVLLEKVFGDCQEAEAQRGYAPTLKTEKKVVYYEGGQFPFSDNEFDYVICSHVLEHVPLEDLPLFFSELQRVAGKGYIEFPTVFYELINYQDVHLWLMNCRDNVILFLDKSVFSSTYIHRVYRELFYGPDTYLFSAFTRYKDLFFCGFEWEGQLRYEVVQEYDRLVNERDFNRWRLYMSGFRHQPKTVRQLGRFVDKCVGRARELYRKARGYSVHRTAVLEKRSLVRIGKGAEIKDYVIIRTYENPVAIGDYVQINPFTVIYGGSGVQIGNNVMIAPHCMIAAGDHDFRQTEKPIRFAGNISKGPIIIEDNVWIGANCTITDGVRIGKDAVVAANSVVTRDVEPYDIVGGVPARKIGNRKLPAGEAGP